MSTEELSFSPCASVPNRMFCYSCPRWTKKSILIIINQSFEQLINQKRICKNRITRTRRIRARLCLLTLAFTRLAAIERRSAGF